MADMEKPSVAANDAAAPAVPLSLAEKEAHAAADAALPSDGAPAPQTDKNLLQKLVPLAPGATYLNLLVYLFCVLFTIAFLVFLNASQGFVLSTIIGTPTTELGTVTGTIGFVDQLVSLPFAWLWGVVSDRYVPRRIVYSLAFLIIGICLFVYPNMTTWTPGLITVRCFYAVGSAAATSMLTACLSDYTVATSGGRLAGTVGLASGVGALIGLFVFLRMPTWFGGESSAGAIRASFYVVASISVVWSVLAFFGLSLGLGFRGRTTPLSGRAEAAGTRAPVANGDSNGVTEGKLAAEAVLPEPVTQEHRQLNIFQSAWLGIKAASDPRVAYGYIGALPARGDTINLTLWLPLFFAYYYFSSGLCPNPDWDVTDPDEVKAVCREAWSKASSMSGVAQVIALIAAVPWGLLCDRISRVAVLLISSCVALVGYAGMVATRDPTRGITYVWACLLGLAETGLIVSSLALVTDRTYIPMEIKGSVAGVYSFMGAVGILITTKVGGVLFDVAARYAWTVGLAFCAICILAGALILGIYRRPVGWRKAAPAPEPAAAQT